jgi:hypothetical protein
MAVRFIFHTNLLVSRDIYIYIFLNVSSIGYRVVAYLKAICGFC